jgi:hypothetical protein
VGTRSLPVKISAGEPSTRRPPAEVQRFPFHGQARNDQLGEQGGVAQAGVAQAGVAQADGERLRIRGVRNATARREQSTHAPARLPSVILFIIISAVPKLCARYQGQALSRCGTTMRVIDYVDPAGTATRPGLVANDACLR